MLKEIFSNMSTEKKAALGLGALAGIVGFYAEITDGQRAANDAKEAAYKGGCDVAREFYEKKGNPNKRRKSS